MNCVMCGGTLSKKFVEHKELGVIVGTFKALVCSKCHEVYFADDVVAKIQQKSKELGLFGLAKKAKVGVLGNSLALRIPKEIAAFLNLRKGTEVRLVPQNRHDLMVRV